MEEMILTGNQLRNEGTKMVLNDVSIAKNLKKIHLGDNNFNEEEVMLESTKTPSLPERPSKRLPRFDDK